MESYEFESITKQPDGPTERQWYFDASVEDGPIKVLGPEQTAGREKGVYEAVWVPIGDLDGLAVYPTSVAEAVRTRRGEWLNGVIKYSD